jgi:hypothetical protein
MATSTLNVYITELGEPCTITNRRWMVAVSHCDGRVLNWSEGRYRHRSGEPWTQIPSHVPPSSPPLPTGWYYDSIPAMNGHVEIEVPPGCYVLRATMHSWFTHGLIYGNWATDHAIVQACCGKDVCVTLYAPTGPQCAVPLFDFVIPLLVQQRVIGREDAQKAMDAMRAVFGPAPRSRFEREQEQWLKSAFQQMTKAGKEEDPEQGR